MIVNNLEQKIFNFRGDKMTKQSSGPHESETDKNIVLIRKNIKKELRNQGYTYESFASLFKKTGGWFSNIVNGYRKISIELLYTIAEKLNIDPASLLPGGNPAELPTFEEYLKSIIDEHTKDETRKIFKEEIEKYFKNKKGED